MICIQLRGSAWAFICGVWQVSVIKAIKWRPQSLRHGLRLAKEKEQSLHHWPWAGQGGYVPVAHLLCDCAAGWMGWRQRFLQQCAILIISRHGPRGLKRQ